MIEERRKNQEKIETGRFIFFLLLTAGEAEREGGVLAETEDFYAEGTSPTNNSPACPSFPITMARDLDGYSTSSTRRITLLSVQSRPHEPINVGTWGSTLLSP